MEACCFCNHLFPMPLHDITYPSSRLYFQPYNRLCTSAWRTLLCALAWRTNGGGGGLGHECLSTIDMSMTNRKVSLNQPAEGVLFGLGTEVPWWCVCLPCLSTAAPLRGVQMDGPPGLESCLCGCHARKNRTCLARRGRRTPGTAVRVCSL